jgi:hypothetical protein
MLDNGNRCNAELKADAVKLVLEERRSVTKYQKI